MTIKILAIDDDKVTHAKIREALEQDDNELITAMNGVDGLKLADEQAPNIILLDIEMAGKDGYQVCAELKANPNCTKIPVIILSSHSAIEERLKGYQVGADDFLVKPFEGAYLNAKVNLLLKNAQQKSALEQQYQEAQNTARVAMSGTVELSSVMKFLKQSLNSPNIELLIKQFFETMRQFSLQSCVMVVGGDANDWFSSVGVISPLEQELLEMCDKETRILDYDNRTIVNFPAVSLLVKNMPIEDDERYGRIKDLLPFLIEAINARINTLATHQALLSQSEQLMHSFNLIRHNLFYLAEGMVKNRSDSQMIMDKLLNELSYDLLGMGMEEQQEEFILDRIDTAIDKTMQKMDTGKEMRNTLTFILKHLKKIMQQHEILMEGYGQSLIHQDEQQDVGGDEDGDIELF